MSLSLVCIAASVVLAGCPGAKTARAPAAEPTEAAPANNGQQAATAGTGDPCAAANATAAPEGTAPPISSRGVPCDPPVCTYHGGSDSYHLCLSRGLGECFHHGASCVPAHRCMFDSKTAAYRTCTTPGDGRCVSFGAPCEPPGQCVYNPSDRRHHRCGARAKDGVCTRYGELCDPE